MVPFSQNNRISNFAFSYSDTWWSIVNDIHQHHILDRSGRASHFQVQEYLHFCSSHEAAVWYPFVLRVRVQHRALIRWNRFLTSRIRTSTRLISNLCTGYSLYHMDYSVWFDTIYYKDPKTIIQDVAVEILTLLPKNFIFQLKMFYNGVIGQ